MRRLTAAATGCARRCSSSSPCPPAHAGRAGTSAPAPAPAPGARARAHAQPAARQQAPPPCSAAAGPPAAAHVGWNSAGRRLVPARLTDLPSPNCSGRGPRPWQQCNARAACTTSPGARSGAWVQWLCELITRPSPTAVSQAWQQRPGAPTLTSAFTTSSRVGSVPCTLTSVARCTQATWGQLAATAWGPHPGPKHERKRRPATCKQCGPLPPSHSWQSERRCLRGQGVIQERTLRKLVYNLMPMAQGTPAPQSDVVQPWQGPPTVLCSKSSSWQCVSARSIFLGTSGTDANSSGLGALTQVIKHRQNCFHGLYERLRLGVQALKGTRQAGQELVAAAR